ncbi:MAG: glycoside hydrolase family 19 protein [Fusobacteriaceae bacterium]
MTNSIKIFSMVALFVVTILALLTIVSQASPSQVYFDDSNYRAVREVKSNLKTPKQGYQLDILRFEKPNLNHLNQDELLIVKTCMSSEFGFYDLAQISYILATAKHESANFQYLEEINGKQQAKRLSYQGGQNYYGRGYLQLTHNYNYKKVGDLLKVDLLNRPELVSQDKILASRILCLWFMPSQHPIDKHINTKKIDYWTARNLVNGDGYLVADKIANSAMQYYNKLTQ